MAIVFSVPRHRKMRRPDTTSYSRCRWRAQRAKPLRLSAGFDGQLQCVPLILSAGRISRCTRRRLERIRRWLRITLDGRSTPASSRPGRCRDLRAEYQSQADGLGVAGRERRRSRRDFAIAQQLGDPCTALPIPELTPAGLRSVEPELVQWKSDGLDDRRAALSAARMPDPKRSR